MPSITFKRTPAHQMYFQRMAFFHRSKKSPVAIIFFIAFAMIPFYSNISHALGSFLDHGYTLQFFIEILIIIIGSLLYGLSLIGVYFLMSFFVQMHWTYIEKKGRAKDIFKEFTYSIDNDLLTITADNGESRFSLEEIAEIILVKRGILIFPTQNMMTFIPRSVFKTEEAYESFYSALGIE